jgi:hypothetical protein
VDRALEQKLGVWWVVVTARFWEHWRWSAFCSSSSSVNVTATHASCQSIAKVRCRVVGGVLIRSGLVFANLCMCCLGGFWMYGRASHAIGIRN